MPAWQPLEGSRGVWRQDHGEPSDTLWAARQPCSSRAGGSEGARWALGSQLGLPGSGQAGPSSRAGRGAPLLAAAARIPSVEERVMVLACSAKCYHISSNFHFLWAGFQLSIFLPDARISQTFRSLRRSWLSQMRRRARSDTPASGVAAGTRCGP